MLHAATVLLGDKLGLYKAMGDGEAITARQLAARTGCDERSLAEWLAAQAASGYVHCDPESGSFWLSEEQAFALTSEDNPVFAPGGLQVAASVIKDVDLVAEAIAAGRGVDWAEHHPDLFEGTDRFFKPNYIGNLVEGWLPALDGVVAKLHAGASVADVGCGYGASTVLMAQAFPSSTFLGTDPRGPSVEAARKAAALAGVAERCRFEVTSAKDYGGAGYDLVCVFDCLHDMGDPVGAAAHVRTSLAEDGTWMICRASRRRRARGQPQPGRTNLLLGVDDDLRARLRSQEVGLALGAQAGEGPIRDVAEQGGFTRFRRAAETPFNVVYEARP